MAPSKEWQAWSQAIAGDPATKAEMLAMARSMGVAFKALSQDERERASLHVGDWTVMTGRHLGMSETEIQAVLSAFGE